MIKGRSRSQQNDAPKGSFAENITANITDKVKKGLNFTEREKVATVERKVQQAKHTEVITSRKADELEKNLKRSEKTDGFVGWMAGTNREKRLAYENARRKANETSKLARAAEQEYIDLMTATGGTVKKELVAPITDYRSPLLSAPTRGAGGNFMDVIKKKTFGAVYPRTLFITIVGASGLPKMDTIGWCDPYVVITNISTRDKHKTEIVYDNPEPVWEENFAVTVSSNRDTIVLEVFDYDRVGQDDYIGASMLPLDPRYICNRECALEINDRKEKNRGTLRVSAMWADEAQPTRETGHFYYRVVFAHGVQIRKLPDAHSKKTGQTLQPGEVFEASERLKPLDENTTYVKINMLNDKWMRSGWVFEKLSYKDEHTHELEELQVLERVTPPKKEGGTFFYKVIAAEGTKLPIEPWEHCTMLTGHAYPKDTILECSQKMTPLASEIIYCKIDHKIGGYIFEDTQGIIKANEGDPYPTLEHCQAPRGEVLDEVFLEKEMHFMICCDPGVYARKGTELDAEKGELLLNGDYMVCDKKKLVRYPGIDSGNVVTWYKRHPEDDWIREDKNGIPLIEEVPDTVIDGLFQYEIVYEGGVTVRQFANQHGHKLNSVLLCGEVVKIKRQVIHAKDKKKKNPTTYLELADSEGWIFDHCDKLGVICVPASAEQSPGFHSALNQSPYSVPGAHTNGSPQYYGYEDEGVDDDDDNEYDDAGREYDDRYDNSFSR